jgi:hypothetical protein
VVRTWPPTGGFAEDELPAYLADGEVIDGRPAVTLADLWAGARRVASTLADVPAPVAVPGPALYRSRPTDQPAPRAAELSARFLRLVRLPGARLAPMIDEWWGTARGGTTTVDRRLRLAAPKGDRFGGWTITGEVRRLTRWHWVPVVVELWPVHDRWTMITMTPRGRVVATRRYFRTGHRAIERFTDLLAHTSAALEPVPTSR